MRGEFSNYQSSHLLAPLPGGIEDPGADFASQLIQWTRNVEHRNRNGHSLKTRLLDFKSAQIGLHTANPINRTS